ncbi:MAG: hypothetical protein WCT14_03940, partial [Treponemataceae bacterium]
MKPFTLNAVNRARWGAFKANRRGYVSLWLFIALFGVTLFSELIANDRPLLIRFDGHFYSPLLKTYTELDFGGEFDTAADYRDPYMVELINAKGWVINPLIHFRYDTINYVLPSPAPSPPTEENWLGTDDKGR